MPNSHFGNKNSYHSILIRLSDKQVISIQKLLQVAVNLRNEFTSQAVRVVNLIQATVNCSCFPLQQIVNENGKFMKNIAFEMLNLCAMFVSRILDLIKDFYLSVFSFIVNLSKLFIFLDSIYSLFYQKTSILVVKKLKFSNNDIKFYVCNKHCLFGAAKQKYLR